MTRIVRATVTDIGQIVPLFDKYRVFYGQQPDEATVKRFLLERFSNQENIVFLAYQHEIPVGFTQLYPTFSSVSLQPFYILNDLFVDEMYRGQGVATMLLKKAQDFCLEKECKGLALETAIDNPAQKLYEKLGWKKDEAFLHYFWSPSKKS